MFFLEMILDSLFVNIEEFNVINTDWKPKLSTFYWIKFNKVLVYLSYNFKGLWGNTNVIIFNSKLDILMKVCGGIY